MTERHHQSKINVEELDVEQPDDVAPVRLREQLAEMVRVADIWYHTNNGYFAGVTVEFDGNGMDMVAEVMHEHSLRYYQSYYSEERERHRVHFTTGADMDRKLATASETQEEMESVGIVF